MSEHDNPEVTQRVVPRHRLDAAADRLRRLEPVRFRADLDEAADPWLDVRPVQL